MLTPLVGGYGGDPVTRLCLVVLLSTAATPLAFAQTRPEAPAPAASAVLVVPEPAAAEDVQGRLNPRPRLTNGKNFSLELRGKFQADSASFSPVVDEADSGFTWRRRRLAIRGELFRRVEFEVEREFGDEKEPWRDVYANVRVTDLLEARGGKFKAPFGLDNSTSSTSHDFIFRSLGTRLAPGREVGGMLHGGLSRGRFSYAVAAFNATGIRPQTDFFDDDQGGTSFDRTYSGRITVQPFDGVGSLPRGLRNLEFGAAAARSALPTGVNGLKGRSVFGYEVLRPRLRQWASPAPRGRRGAHGRAGQPQGGMDPRHRRLAGPGRRRCGPVESVRSPAGTWPAPGC